MTDCGHKDQVAHLVDRFERWKGYECPYCEIATLREEITKYKTWAASCDPSPAVQAVISELAALQTDCSTARWVRDHCLGLLRGQLPSDSIAESNDG